MADAHVTYGDWEPDPDAALKYDGVMPGWRGGPVTLRPSTGGCTTSFGGRMSHVDPSNLTVADVTPGPYSEQAYRDVARALRHYVAIGRDLGGPPLNDPSLYQRLKRHADKSEKWADWLRANAAAQDGQEAADAA